MEKENQKKKFILVVDDEEIIAEVIKLNLQKEYYVLTVLSGKEAIRIIKYAPYIDLVITDLEMPEGDGESLINYIRGEGLIMPCILMSGGNDPRCERWAEYGFDYFVAKPFSPSVLKETVKDILNFKSSLRWFEPEEE